MLRTRVLSAVILGPIVLYLVYLGGAWVLFLVTLLCLLALRELFEMAEGLGFNAGRISGYVAGLIVILSAYFAQGRYLPFLFVVWLLFCLATSVIRYPDQSIGDTSFNYLAVSYVAVLFAHLVLLRSLEQGLYLTFLTLAVTWATDTGAYFAGRAFGRHSLAPRVSPHKTIEGSIGGLLAAAGIGALIGYWVPNQTLSPMVLAGFGLVAGITGQLGDLVESALKRFAGVKDSGQIIPGHGGILDRFDSFLFTVPTVYYLFIGLIIS
ncbi:MAG TPA: phosphatidate cytidylyltransferase [Desulfobacteria bacterium]|nr:phosphatidate cytidylyltransferase [Desulfobacteria bacterium]